jgi:hypothetical protein
MASFIRKTFCIVLKLQSIPLYQIKYLCQYQCVRELFKGILSGHLMKCFVLKIFHCLREWINGWLVGCSTMLHQVQLLFSSIKLYGRMVSF